MLFHELSESGNNFFGCIFMISIRFKKLVLVVLMPQVDTATQVQWHLLGKHFQPSMMYVIPHSDFTFIPNNKRAELLLSHHFPTALKVILIKRS